MSERRTHTTIGDKLVAPVANINGTSRDELVRNYVSAKVALQAAIDAVRLTSPHGRDFQTCAEPYKAHRIAREQHIGRLALLESITEEMDALAHMVIDGVAVTGV